MFNNCIYFNLVTLNRKISSIWQESFSFLGLSPSHGYLLAAIVEKPDSTQKELGEIMELDPSTITRFIDKLANKGLLEKTSRGKGARFRVTSHGEEVYKEIKIKMDELFSRMEEHFGREQFKKYVSSLHSARKSFGE